MQPYTVMQQRSAYVHCRGGAICDISLEDGKHSQSRKARQHTDTANSNPWAMIFAAFVSSYPLMKHESNNQTSKSLPEAIECYSPTLLTRDLGVS